MSGFQGFHEFGTALGQDNCVFTCDAHAMHTLALEERLGSERIANDALARLRLPVQGFCGMAL